MTPALAQLIQQSRRDAEAHDVEASNWARHGEKRSEAHHRTLAQVCRWYADQIEAALALPDDSPAMADAAEMLWVVLANVSGGDWTKQSPEWQDAAARWRDNYFEALKLLPGGREPKEEKP